MVTERWIGPVLALSLLCAGTCGQSLAPVGDSVSRPLLPSGILESDVTLDGNLAYVFSDEYAASVVHLVGDVGMRIGDATMRTLQASEAVVWISKGEEQGRSYNRLDIFLWRDATVYELAGTITRAPVLFVTVSTYGTLKLSSDDVARESSKQTEAYREGRRLREAIAANTDGTRTTAAALDVFNPTGLGSGSKDNSPRPILQFRSHGDLTIETVDSRQVMVVTGGVYLARGSAGGDDYMEIQADSAVVFFAEGESLGTQFGQDPTRATGSDGVPSTGSTASATQRANEDQGGQRMSSAFGDARVEAVYLEGDVRMAVAETDVRASRLYYNLLNDKAIILDAIARTHLPDRDVPLYLRADEIRQLSARQFSADNAILTTSEFYTPHYHVGAQHVELLNQTQSGPRGSVSGVTAGSFRIRHATLNFGGQPVLYWPYARGGVDTSETSIRSLRTGYSDDFGGEVETEWHFFNVMGMETPPGFDATLSLDLYTQRGPAIGVDATYQRDRYFGEVRSYLMTDDGTDSLGRDREVQSRREARGRFLARHRHYLDDDWEVTLELSYISDRDFLEEFCESEFDNEKEQETLLYLKKQRENWAFTATFQSRILDFTSQTERLPDFAFYLFGEPIGERVSWFSENRAGMVRRRGADRTLREVLREGEQIASSSTVRADSRQELELPLDLGDWRVVPFVTARGTSWDSSLAGGGRSRAFGSIGIRGSTYFQKTFPDYNSSMWDINGVRHVIKPDFVAWVSEANHRADDLYPFDASVEGIDTADGVLLGVRQRFQTKRGEGATARTVDFLTYDLEVGAFNDADHSVTTNGFGSYSRPENSLAKNYVNSSTIWRMNDRTAVLSEMNYDLNDGRVDVLNVSVAVERTPRLSYLVGYRFIDKSDSNLLGFDLNYRMTEKHTLALRELFDLERGRTLDFTVAFIRRYPRWFTALSFELDEAEDDFGLSLAVWPEGIPQATVGSRRFTGLANTTRLSR